jgi:hypothetical protein
MTLPAAYAPISLGQIQGEFTGANPISLSEYYRGAGYTTENEPNNPNVPSYPSQYTVSYTSSVYHVFDDESNSTINFTQSGAVGSIQNDGANGGYCTGSLDYGQKYYTVTWPTPFTNNNYNYNITITENLSASGYWEGSIALCAVNKYADRIDFQFYVNYDEAGYPISFCRAFYVEASEVITSYVRGPIALSNFYSTWRGILVTMYYSREAANTNYFYLSANGFPTIVITTPYNNTSSSINSYIAPNVNYIITSNANTSILPANFVEEITYDEYDNATYNYTWPTPITGMWLEDGGGYDYNDLQWTPGAGTIYQGGDGNFYYILNV